MYAYNKLVRGGEGGKGKGKEKRYEDKARITLFPTERVITGSCHVSSIKPCKKVRPALCGPLEIFQDVAH